MNYSKAIVLLGVLIIVGCEQSLTQTPIPVLAELASIRLTEQLDPLAGQSLDDFSRLVNEATIVAIGDSRHDTKEQFEIKALLSRTLISELGFRIIVFEESFSHGLALDDYVTTGQGEIRSILNELAGWYLWDTEEMVVFIDWIRRFNETVPQDDMVRVFGMDITAPALGISHAAKVANNLEPSMGWTTREYGFDLQAGDYWPRILERYSYLPRDEAEIIGQNLEDLSVFLATRARASDSSADVQIAAIEAEIGRRGHDMFSSAGIAEVGAVRERGMAFAVEWIRDHVAAATRTIIWTHNLHAAKSSFRMPEIAEGDLMPMGVLLDRVHGDNYLAIGGAFGTGEFPANLPPGERSFARLNIETVDGAIAQLGQHTTLLNLAGSDRSLAAMEWLSAEREWRMQDTVAILSATKSFDAIYYVDRVTRAQPTPLALERFQEQRD